MGDSRSIEVVGTTSLKEPLLLCGATERTGDDRLPGAFCPDRHVWLVAGEPLVGTPSSLLEMITKTKQEMESDDQREPAFLEMLTKTHAQLESDDDRFNLSLIEMMTKTFSNAERDD